MENTIESQIILNINELNKLKEDYSKVKSDDNNYKKSDILSYLEELLYN